MIVHKDPKKNLPTSFFFEINQTFKQNSLQ